MGLLKVGVETGKGIFADQWREYFYCSSLDDEILVKKGEKRKGKNNYNTKGSDNIISNGSIIAVNEGQCAIIVDQGVIADICAEAGEFIYDTSTEPSVFYGGLGKGILESFKTFGKRFTFAGDTAKDQRVYFFNTKEILSNKYGTKNPIPFRVVDQNAGIDIDISIRCHGEYSYKIIDPILFYKNICGNIESSFKREEIDSQLKSEMLTALQPAFGKLSAMGIRYSALPGHTIELANALNEVLDENWIKRYGIEISTVAISSINAPEEDEKMIKELQRNAAFVNPGMAAAHLTAAQAEAMKLAAANKEAGPFMAFAGMNMAAGAGGINAGQLFQMATNQKQNLNNENVTKTLPRDKTAEQSINVWTCVCGSVNNGGKFCPECGAKNPNADQWVCKCGTVNKGKFCSECGNRRA